MKTINYLFYIAVIAMVTFASCTKEKKSGEDDNKKPTEKDKVAYILNYGSYSGANGEISVYNITKGELTDTSGYSVVNGVDFSSKIESATIVDNKMYIMSNNGDKIDIINASTLKQTENPISTDITKPRFMVENNGIGYISCWGNVVDWKKMANSYIAKMDLATNAITKINVAGGLEGMAIVGNTLYLAQTARNTVVTMDLTTDAIDSIKVPAVPQQFAVGTDGKLYVSLVSKYSTPFPADSLGVAVINTTNNTVSDRINLAGIGSNGFIHISTDKNTLYVMAKEAYPGTGSSIKAIDLSNNSISELITGESYKGFGVNPDNGNIYVAMGASTTSNGEVKIYNKSGNLDKTLSVLISPKHILFHQVK